MTTAKEVMKMIKDNDVKYVDFRFTDPRGKWQHVTFDVTMIEETPLPKARCSTAPRSLDGKRSTSRT
jgi:glutamine synthetase